MNDWKFRHEGSPVASADLPFDQIVQGLVDGKIHVEDEVKGPTDAGWQKFEDHPAFAELVSELEPEEEDHHDEETSLDMNPMIDVALVLLIFFILTTTYTQLQKIIEAAEASQTEGGVKVVSKEQAESTMVMVKATFKDGKTTIFVDGQETPLEGLVAKLKPYARDPAKRTILLEHDGDVPHKYIVAIQDKGKSAGFNKVALLVPGK